MGKKLHTTRSISGLLREPAAEPHPTVPQQPRPPEHRCGNCCGPYGKSAIRCPNEP